MPASSLLYGAGSLTTGRMACIFLLQTKQQTHGKVFSQSAAKGGKGHARIQGRRIEVRQGRQRRLGEQPQAGRGHWTQRSAQGLRESSAPEKKLTIRNGRPAGSRPFTGNVLFSFFRRLSPASPA